MGSLYKAKIRTIWNYLWTQDRLFWLVNIYLFLEYVRPQTLFPAIDVLPYTQIVLLWAFALSALQGSPVPLQNPAGKLLWVFFGVILISSTLAFDPAMAFSYVPEFVAWMIIFWLIVKVINTEERFFIFMLAFLLYNFKMSQFAFLKFALRGFSYSNWGGGGGPGWFHNSGEFGIEMCIFLSLSIYFFITLRHHWPWWKQAFFALFPLTALSGTISSSSRGAMVGGAAVLLWVLFKSRHKVKGMVALAVVGTIAFTFVPSEVMERFDRAGEDKTSINRMIRWEKGLEMAAEHPLFGVGYKNWAVADSRLFDGEGELLSHNIFIECMSELGYVGLFVFVLMILSTLIANYQTRKLAPDRPYVVAMAHGLDGALIGFLVSGFFVTVLYYPYFWINLAMTMALNGVAHRNASLEYRS